MDIRKYFFPINLNSEHQTRYLFGFSFYNWGKHYPNAYYLSIDLLFMRFDFRIGNGKTLWWVRWEQLYSWWTIKKQGNDLPF